MNMDYMYWIFAIVFLIVIVGCFISLLKDVKEHNKSIEVLENSRKFLEKYNGNTKLIIGENDSPTHPLFLQTKNGIIKLKVDTIVELRDALSDAILELNIYKK